MTTTLKEPRAQLNARIPEGVKRNVKMEAARAIGPDGRPLTVELSDK